ncbi:hypothetical protein [Anoxybacillus flavithermus]|nr:hypothetical protein [Anoxybacillus flavithermus]
MLFRNKKTGLIWEIVDDDYEVVKEKEQPKQPVKKSPTKKG